MTCNLNILALRYALGELPGAEAAAFEGQLETDQSAREALADAVLLMAAMRKLPAEVELSRRATSPIATRSRIAAVVSCLAASLLVVLLIKWPAGKTTAHRTSGDATAIVGTWSELGGDDMVLAEFDSELSRDDSASDVPDWMVAAVLEAVDTPPRDEGTL